MSNKSATAGWALATAGAALAGWWWQSRDREPELEERTRRRLRAWERR